MDAQHYRSTLHNHPATGNGDDFTIVIKKYFYHWPLFLVSIIVCVLGAFFYLKNSNPVYKISAAVIIKDEKKEAGEKNTLSELYHSNTAKLVENEIEVLKSRRLVLQVVNDLRLWVKYVERNGMRRIDLYKSGPVSFVLLEPATDAKESLIVIKIKDRQSFYLKNGDGEFHEYSFKSSFRDGRGTWRLEPTVNIEHFGGKIINISIANPNEMAREYQGSIVVEQSNKLASTINLSLKDEVAERGKDVLNDLLDKYSEASIAEKNRLTKSTIEFIDSRISSLAGELNSSERNIEGYRSTRGITDISSQSQVYLENVQANDAKLNEVNVQLSVIDGIDRNLQSSKSPQFGLSTLGIEDPLLSRSLETLSQLQLQREKLLATTPETNPDFEALDRQIRTSKNAIKESIVNVRSALLTTREKLLSYNAHYEASIRNVPVQERELVDKTRQKEIKQNLYVYLLQKREEIALNYSAILSDARVIDYAFSDSRPSLGLLAYGGALFLGFLLPAGFVWLRTSMNTRVTTAAEIETRVGMPVLATIAKKEGGSNEIITDTRSSIISEDFRKVRTELNLLKGDNKRGWLTLVTSSIANEGKSFITSNLAYFLALSGKKTVVVDLDLRRSKLGGIFDISASDHGITNFLAGEISKEHLIQGSKLCSNLDIIKSGPLPPSPSELLESPKIGDLLSWLKTNYDYILIDTAPNHLVTDAKILAAYCDTVIFIVRQSYTYKSLLGYLESLIKENTFKNLKIIFNSIENGKYGFSNNYGGDYYAGKKTSGGTDIISLLKSFFKRF